MQVKTSNPGSPKDLFQSPQQPILDKVPEQLAKFPKKQQIEKYFKSPNPMVRRFRVKVPHHSKQQFEQMVIQSVPSAKSIRQHLLKKDQFIVSIDPSCRYQKIQNVYREWAVNLVKHRPQSNKINFQSASLQENSDRKEELEDFKIEKFNSQNFGRYGEYHSQSDFENQEESGFSSSYGSAQGLIRAQCLQEQAGDLINILSSSDMHQAACQLQEIKQLKSQIAQLQHQFSIHQLACEHQINQLLYQEQLASAHVKELRQYSVQLEKDKLVLLETLEKEVKQKCLSDSGGPLFFFKCLSKLSLQCYNESQLYFQCKSDSQLAIAQIAFQIHRDYQLSEKMSDGTAQIKTLLSKQPTQTDLTISP